jgi:uracil-DNA glycosylase family 4
MRCPVFVGPDDPLTITTHTVCRVCSRVEEHPIIEPCTRWAPGKWIKGPEADFQECKTCGCTFDEHPNPFGKPIQCEPCTLFREPGPVEASGPQDAAMIMIGEAPGADEVDYPFFRAERMAPFIGGSGRLLTALCAHAGIYRKAVRLGNTVKCRPPNNRTPTSFEIRCCAPFLIQELNASPANVIVALGEVPLSVLTDKKGIGLHRGVPCTGFAGRKVFPTWHPAFIARSQHNWPFAVHDLARASAQSAFPEIHRIPYDIIRCADPATHGQRFLGTARARGAATFDFETTGLSAKYSQIAMVGLAAGPDQAEVYDWTPGAAKLFQEVLDDPAIEIIGQNILYFDLPFAEEKGHNIDKVWPRVFDTMVTFHLCNSSYGQMPIAEQRAGTFRVRGAEKDLSMIASCHTDMEYWKSRDNYKSDLREVCGKDVIATHRAALDPASGIKAELKSYDMLDLYYKHVLPVHPVLHRMTKRGVKVHEERAAKWAIALTQKATKLEGILKEGLGQPNLNLSSPQQLMKLFYEDMGLPVQYVNDKKKGVMRPTANADAIEALAAMNPENKILGSIVDIRHLRKMESTYIRPGLESTDGRFHPKMGVSKASTGRFNHWDPNSANQPEEMRDIWIPDAEDHILMSADWSQIEWRLAMVLSGDPVGLELLTSGLDNHSSVAAETLGKALGPNPNGTCDHPDCTEHVTEANRYASKFIVYGLGYGRGAESISVGHGLPMDFVERFIAKFFSRFAVFKAWRERNVDFVKKNHYLANAWKRRRWWYTYQVTEVYNFPQQSNAADMMYDLLIELDRELPRDATLRLTVHDEAVVNTPMDIAKETYRVMKACMERAWPQIVEASADSALVKKFYPNGWFCPADIHVGTDWAMCKSKNKVKKAQRTELEKRLGLVEAA